MLDPQQISPTAPRPARKPVGITKGPGEANHEYTFVSRDDDQVLKNGEYVYYELADPDYVALHGTTINAPIRRVLGRIMKREPLQLYPDTFLGEPEISPAQVAAMVGYNARTNELFSCMWQLWAITILLLARLSIPGFLHNRASRSSWPMI